MAKYHKSLHLINLNNRLFSFKIWVHRNEIYGVNLFPGIWVHLRSIAWYVRKFDFFIYGFTSCIVAISWIRWALVVDWVIYKKHS